MPKRKNRKAKARTPAKLKKIESPRQLLAVKNLVEAVRKAKGKKSITLGKILQESGYSIAVSKHPSTIIEGKNFQRLLSKYLPDDKIASIHGDLLQASVLSHYVFPKGEDNKTIRETVESVPGCKVMKIRVQGNWKRAYFWTPDNMSRLGAIKEAYKIKNRYPAERHEHLVAKVEVVKF